MRQSYPRLQPVGNSENVSQGIDLKAVECLVNGSLEEGFELVDAILDLCSSGFDGVFGR